MGEPGALIETLDLVDNYGGVLQAYAMQWLLKARGIAPVTDARAGRSLSTRDFLRLIKKGLGRRSFDDVMVPTLWNAPGRRMRRFVDDNILLIRWPGKQCSRVAAAQSAVYGVSGSDQVWRPAYTDVWRNLFDFRGGESLRKVAYAGSFGVEDLSEFSPGDRRRFGELLGRFQAVSVREQSAQRLLRDTFGIDSAVVLDPTFLVDAEVWNGFANTAGTPSSEPYLAYMVLDRRADLATAVNDRARSDGLTVLDFYPPRVTSVAAYRKAPSSFELPPVSAWLRTLRDASLVVTDSFHVCVFSMIFGTPFICLRNESRGATRFDSLEAVLGLEGAFVSGPKGILDPSSGRVPDNRNENIERMRLASERFLDESLGICH